MANEMVLPNPVSAYLQGQQASQQNKLAQMQIQQAQDAQTRDAKFRELLPAYLQGGTNGLAALYATDPERTMQAQAFMTQQNQLAQTKKVNEAKQAYAQAQGVLSSEAPATYMRFLIPKVAQQWAEQNGKSVEEMTDEEATALAQQVSAIASAQAGIQPEEYTLGEGDVRFRGGKEIASVTKKASDDAFTLSEGQTRFDASGKPIASVSKSTTEDKSKQEQTIFERANSLRDEYDAQSKEFQGATQAYQRVLSASKNPSAAGDLALIFSYMRTLDPGSSVREGEFANAENAGGIPARIRSQYNKVLSGERLSPEQRKDFVTKAGELYQGQKDIDRKRRDRYRKLAERNKVDPMDVLGDEVSIDVPADALSVGQSTSIGDFKVTRKK